MPPCSLLEMCSIEACSIEVCVTVQMLCGFADCVCICSREQAAGPHARPRQCIQQQEPAGLRASGLRALGLRAAWLEPQSRFSTSGLRALRDEPQSGLRAAPGASGAEPIWVWCFWMASGFRVRAVWQPLPVRGRAGTARQPLCHEA